jgi:hypothetical protein
MKRPLQLRSLSAAIAVLSAAAGTHAAPPEHVAEVGIEGRFGQSTAPYSTSAFRSTSGYGGFLLLGARLQLARRWQLGLRVPLVLMRVEQPAGALYAEAAWANPELDASLNLSWLERDGWALAFVPGLAIGLPLAEHDSAQLAGRALRLGNALEGFSEPGLFTPGVLPLTPTGQLTLESLRWRFSASLSLPLLWRVSNADLPPEAKPRSLGVTPVAALEARLRILAWLTVAVTPRLTAQAIAPADDGAASWQLLAAGRAEFRLGEHVALSALVQAPVGGPLGGSTGAAGVAAIGMF